MNTITLQVVQHLRPGGLEKLVLNLLRFASPNHNVYVVALEGEKESAIADWPELQPFRARLFFLGKPPGRSLKTVFKLRRLIKKLRANVIHSHHMGPLLYARLATTGLKVSHIQTEHDSWHLHNAKQRHLTRWLLKGSKIQLVADAPRVADQLEQLGIATDHVIINGIDTNHFSPGNQLLSRQMNHLPLNKTLIGCAGRLVPEKGLDTLLQALALMPDHLQLVIAGHGPEQEKLERIASQLNITNRIHWLGHCSNMRGFYRAIDIFCMPSRQEGLPLALLEAQACGKNVIATNVGGIPDLLCPQSGQLVEPDQPIRLAQAIMNGLNNSADHSEQNAQYIRCLADVRMMAATYEALAY